MENTEKNTESRRRIEQMKQRHFQGSENTGTPEKTPTPEKKTVINEIDSGITINQEENKKTVVNEQNPKKTKLTEHNLLLPDEKAALDKQKAEENGDTENKKTGKIGRRNADRKKADDKDEKLVEYTDIIDFMFKEFMMAGLDWSLNKIVNNSVFLTSYVINETIDAIKMGASATEDEAKKTYDWYKKDDEVKANTDDVKAKTNDARPQNPQTQTIDGMTAFRQKLGKVHGAHVSRTAVEIPSEKNKKLLNSVFGYVRRGEIDSLKFLSPETRDMMKKMSPEQIKEKFSKDNTSNVATNMLNHVAMIEQISSNIATNRMLTAKAGDKNAYASQDEAQVFTQMRLEAMKEYKQLLGVVSKNPQEHGNFLEFTIDFAKQSQQAIQATADDLNQGKYQEKGALLPLNPATKAMEEKLALGKGNTTYSAELSLVDMAADINNSQDGINKFRKEVEHREQIISARRADYQTRRENLNQIKEISGTPSLAHKTGINKDAVINSQRISLAR